VDALAKLRRGGAQRVVVEHVHIHAGAQAIVGAVSHTGGPRALIEKQGQPHATIDAGPFRFRRPSDVEPKHGPGSPASLQW
jgi:hypothetical protein